MKILLSVLALVMVAGTAQAERMVMKNPERVPAGAKVIHDFTIGGNRYVAVDVPSFSALAMDVTTEGGFQDVQIELPVTEEVGSDSDSATAWHVEAMKYSELSSQADGRGITVAILDTGVDYTHSALKNRMWVNNGEIPNNGIDDDGNGFIDDVNGFDFESDDSDPMDNQAHGTHCAGTVAAEVDAASLGQGSAPGAKIMAVRIIGNERKGFLTDAVAGIKYAADNGAKIMSNSWRVYKSWTPFDPSEENVKMLKDAIAYAGEKGAIFLAAAGNETRNIDTHSDLMYPGGFEGLSNLVVVAASDKSGAPASFTNYGKQHVMIAAPGVNIYSTVPGNRWSNMSGTSMATPLAAGIMARALSAGMSMDQAIAGIRDTSTRTDIWAEKVSSQGIIQPWEYLSSGH
ncbi:MAG: S8 family serine peptidase [Oligoflexia bacterium]|nr:S8 family serine peptidase [Oligoflexia bacterium]